MWTRQLLDKGLPLWGLGSGSSRGRTDSSCCQFSRTSSSGGWLMPVLTVTSRPLSSAPPPHPVLLLHAPHPAFLTLETENVVDMKWKV